MYTHSHTHTYAIKKPVGPVKFAGDPIAGVRRRGAEEKSNERVRGVKRTDVCPIV